MLQYLSQNTTLSTEKSFVPFHKSKLFVLCREIVVTITPTIRFLLVLHSLLLVWWIFLQCKTTILETHSRGDTLVREKAKHKIKPSLGRLRVVRDMHTVRVCIPIENKKYKSSNQFLPTSGPQTNNFNNKVWFCLEFCSSSDRIVSTNRLASEIPARAYGLCLELFNWQG